MSLQKRLVALMALLLVIGLAVADIVIYASVRSYPLRAGRLDAGPGRGAGVQLPDVHVRDSLSATAATWRPLSESALSRRVSTDVYVVVLNRQGQVILRRPSGSPTHPDPPPVLTGHPGAAGARALPAPRRGGGATPARSTPTPTRWSSGRRGDPDGAYRTIAVAVPQGRWSRRCR